MTDAADSTDAAGADGAAGPTDAPAHDSGETVPAAIDGVRLALGSGTPGDWTAYQDDWAKVLQPSSSPQALPEMPGS